MSYNVYIHFQIKDDLDRALSELVSLAREHNYFLTTEPVVDNNIDAREAANLEGPGEALAELCSQGEYRIYFFYFKSSRSSKVPYSYRAIFFQNIRIIL